ncbi:hypothetical protein ACFQH6_15310 [Halobacteriaceae archaeon GCM10025711]
MRYKPVPDPAAPDALDTARNAVPLVPADREACEHRLADRLDLADPEAARGWLTFLLALGLARETASGVARARDPPEDVAAAFRERIYGVDEMLAVLDAGPVTADAACDRFADHVPHWERHRYPEGWEAVWRERVRRLLDWAVRFDLAERTDDGYRRVS